MTDPAVLTILAVDDDPDDSEFLRESIYQAGFNCKLMQLNNGRDLLSYLAGDDQFQGVAEPDIIFLDLNMPGVTGYQVLDKISNDSSLRRIPILVVTEVKTKSILDRVRKLNTATVVSKEIFFKSCERIVGGLIEKVQKTKELNTHRRRHRNTFDKAIFHVFSTSAMDFEAIRQLFSNQHTVASFNHW